MSANQRERPGASGSSPPARGRPISLMVGALAAAVDLAAPQDDLRAEAGLIGSLAILANATFRAIAQTADLKHQLACGDPDSIVEGDGLLDEEDFRDWLDHANRLRLRIRRLKDTGGNGGGSSYESRSFDELERACHHVDSEILSDFRLRREAEARALPAGRLIALASRLRASRSNGEVGEPHV